MREARDTSAQAELPAKREAFLTALRGFAQAAGELDQAFEALQIAQGHGETVAYPPHWTSFDEETAGIQAWCEAVQQQSVGGAS
jgi:hypothetical protein